jgi:hypothetical protein
MSKGGEEEIDRAWKRMKQAEARMRELRSENERLKEGLRKAPKNKDEEEKRLQVVLEGEGIDQVAMLKLSCVDTVKMRNLVQAVFRESTVRVNIYAPTNYQQQKTQDSQPQRKKKRKACYKCGEGHAARDCGNEESCPLCQKFGHNAGGRGCGAFRSALDKARKATKVEATRAPPKNEENSKVDGTG